MGTKKVLKFFPLELWAKVVDKLSSREDVVNVDKALPELGHVIRNVLAQPKFSFELVFPAIIKYLSVSDALSCRMCCKTWSTAVDTFYNNITNPHNSHKYPWPLSKNLVFLDPENTGGLALLETMDKHPRNPLVSRNLLVYMDRHGNETYLQPFVSFTNVWLNLRHVDICCSAATVCEVLKLAQNLCSLRVPFWDEYYFHGPSSNFPDLPSLEALSIYELEPTDKNHLQNILLRKYSKQLTSLMVEVGDSLEQFEYPKLKELSVECHSDHGKVFKSLLKTDLHRLTKLQIHLQSGPGYLQDLVEITHKLKFLRSLELVEQPAFHGFQFLPLEVAQVMWKNAASPTIHTLSISINNRDGDRDLSFIVLFPSIRRLILSLTYLNSELEEIDDNGDNLLACFCSDTVRNLKGTDNLWQLFTSLEKAVLVKMSQNNKGLRGTILYQKGHKRMGSFYSGE